MRLTAAEEKRRQGIINHALRVNTREEIAEARAAVGQWLQEHPDDPNIDWALETVWMIEHCLDLEDAEREAAA